MIEAALLPAEAFALLQGTWHVERVVSGQAAITGTLTVRAINRDESEYSERVTVRMQDDTKFAGSTRYRVRRLEDGFSLWFWESGELFEEVRFQVAATSALRAEAAHACGQDRYISTYVLGPGRRLSVRHVVTGPRKDYVSATDFYAISGAAAV